MEKLKQTREVQKLNKSALWQSGEELSAVAMAIKVLQYIYIYILMYLLCVFKVIEYIKRSVIYIITLLKKKKKDLKQ